MSLTFQPPDLERFPCLGLASRAIEEGGTLPAVLNAANEEAVAAFLAERIGFLQIEDIIGETLARHRRREASDLEAVLAADGWARDQARRLIAAPTLVS
jgi:1-deoxy-D-xylulose-5-phosphate reductoisomerase